MKIGFAELDNTRQTCERCGRLLRPGAAVWLELDLQLNLYFRGGVAPDRSQGYFPFGADCATIEINHTLAELRRRDENHT